MQTGTATFTFTAATSSLTLLGNPATAAVGATIALTSAGGTGTDAVSYATTSTGCLVTGSSLTATAAGTCAVTATQGTQTATALFTFTAATSATGKRVVFYNLEASSADPNRSYDQTASAPTALIRNAFVNPGSSFLGWNTKGNGRGVWYADGEVFPFTSDTELFPIWGTPGQPYKITAKMEGTDKASVAFLAAPKLDGTPSVSMNYQIGVSRNGIVFAERTVSSPGTYVFDLGTPSVYYFYVNSVPSTPATLTLGRTVTFNADLGTGTMADQFANVATALTANAFTRPGYLFDGWATSANGSNAYANGALYPFTANATLYARWVAAPLRTVTFNANGGTGTMANQTASQFTTLSANAFTRPGYIFEGWQTADGNRWLWGYGFETDLTVYARWKSERPTLTFDANGGSGTMANQSANVATALTANTFTRPGYVFDGWATSATGIKNYANGALYPFTADATLYARWVTAPSSTVTFNANGGSGTMANQSTNVATALTANAFTRTGYVFDGWATTPTGIRTYAAGASYPFTSTATLYARWVPTFTVTFNANGGTGTMATQTAGGSTALTANAFTRKAYAFGGWATSATGKSAYADGGKYPFTSNATLYAGWVCKPFEVTVTGAYGLGTTKASVYFKTTSELPLTTVTARTTTGGYSATITTSALTGVIYVTGIVKDAAYKFKVTATNTAGCSSTNPNEPPFRQ
jgi:uncharacterized repeat protein (TIGR02543 family)